MDRPTPWTQSTLDTRPSKKRRCRSVLFTEDPDFGTVSCMDGTSLCRVEFPVVNDGDWSVTVWAKTRRMHRRRGRGYRLFTVGDTTLFVGSHVSLRKDDGSSRVSEGVDVGLRGNTWYHFAAVIRRSTGRVQVYTDGALVMDEGWDVSVSAGPGWVGGDGFKGFLVGLKVFDSAVSGEDLLEEYDARYAAMHTNSSTPFSARVSWSPIFGTSSYKITMGSDTVYTEDTTHEFYGLDPGTVYTIRVYNSRVPGGEYAHRLTRSIRTPVDDKANYDVDGLIGDRGVFDITSFPVGTQRSVLDKITEVVPANERIKIDVGGADTTCVVCGPTGEMDLKGSANLFLPSDSEIIITSSDGASIIDSSTVIRYQRDTGRVTLDSRSYGGGQTFVANGMKVTVVDV